MDEKATKQSAAVLSAGRLKHERMGALPGNLRPRDEVEAYLVQDALHEHYLATGFGTVTGHKIGCTTLVMQRFLAIDNPCAGGVLEGTTHMVEGTFVTATCFIPASSARSPYVWERTSLQMGRRIAVRRLSLP